MNSGAKTPSSLIERIVYLKTWSKTCRRLVEALPDWVTPNFVTLLRAALAVPIFRALSDGRFWTALAFFVLAMALDVLDGAIAHIKGMCTPSGAFLDPLADKLIFCGALFAVWQRLPPWILALAGASVLYAAGITLVRMYRLVRGRKLSGEALAQTVAAKTAGKVKTLFDCLAVMVIMTGLAQDSSPAVDAGGALAVFGSIVAAALYFLPVGRVIGLRTRPEGAASEKAA